MPQNNQALIEVISEEARKMYGLRQEEWEFKPLSHHGGFIFGKAPLLPINTKNEYFNAKFDGVFLYLFSSRKENSEVLEQLENLFHAIVQKENYYTFNNQVKILERVKIPPIKPVGVKAEELFTLLNEIPDNTFSFTYNSHGNLCIEREDNYVFWVTFDFECQLIQVSGLFGEILTIQNKQDWELLKKQ